MNLLADPQLFIAHDMATQLLWDCLPRPLNETERKNTWVVAMTAGQVAASLHWARYRIEGMRAAGQL